MDSCHVIQGNAVEMFITKGPSQFHLTGLDPGWAFCATRIARPVDFLGIRQSLCQLTPFRDLESHMVEDSNGTLWTEIDGGTTLPM
jgi:hypothetical protein